MPADGSRMTYSLRYVKIRRRYCLNGNTGFAENLDYKLKIIKYSYYYCLLIYLTLLLMLFLLPLLLLSLKC